MFKKIFKKINPLFDLKIVSNMFFITQYLQLECKYYELNKINNQINKDMLFYAQYFDTKLNNVKQHKEICKRYCIDNCSYEFLEEFQRNKIYHKIKDNCEIRLQLYNKHFSTNYTYLGHRDIEQNIQYFTDLCRNKHIEIQNVDYLLVNYYRHISIYSI
jgi:hypothetical protein